MMQKSEYQIQTCQAGTKRKQHQKQTTLVIVFGNETIRIGSGYKA